MNFFNSLFIFNFLIVLSFTTGVHGIIGGQFADKGQFKYEISLQMKMSLHFNTWIPICNGAIIGKQHVIVAATCVIGPDEQFKKEVFSILGGVNNIRTPGILVEIEKMFVPKEYFRQDPTKRSKQYIKMGDIAVLKLRNELTLGPHSLMDKLDLPTVSISDRRYETMSPIVSGFGFQRKVKEYTYKTLFMECQELKFAETNIVPFHQCKNAYSSINEARHICAQVKQRKPRNHEGTCTADEGAPLVVHENLLIGILSEIIENCDERSRPAVYTNIKHYVNFINKAMNEINSPEDTRYAVYINKKMTSGQTIAESDMNLVEFIQYY